MAAITPASVTHLGITGSYSLVLARFTSVDDGDTWASGLNGVVTAIAAQTGDPGTQASAGFSHTQSAGTFTFYPGEDNLGLDLIVIKS